MLATMDLKDARIEFKTSKNIKALLQNAANSLTHLRQNFQPNSHLIANSSQSTEKLRTTFVHKQSFSFYLIHRRYQGHRSIACE